MKADQPEGQTNGRNLADTFFRAMFHGDDFFSIRPSKDATKRRANEVTTMKTNLDYKTNFLCVLAESEVADGPHGRTLVKEWYPVHPADEAEARPLMGRPVTAADSGEGIFVDEEGNVFQLASGGETKPLEGECVAAERQGDLTALLKASLREVRKSGRARGSGWRTEENHRGKPGKPAKERERKSVPAPGETVVNGTAAVTADYNINDASDTESSQTFAPLNLRQKLALVRRRLAYVQKRGRNERHNYSYVTAADIAGAVGDILAELGVVVVPRLESISHEPARTGRTDCEHLTHVVMSYSFVDVDTAEEITVKVAGEGVDAGDKAPYKAMTGALKYALLQSFLLATGDDPEDERVSSSNRSAPPRVPGSERMITA